MVYPSVCTHMAVLLYFIALENLSHSVINVILHFFKELKNNSGDIAAFCVFRGC